MSTPTHHFMGDDHCPHCGHLLDAVTNAGRNEATPPRPGDLSVCLECTKLLRFDHNLRLQLLTRKEYNQLPRDCRRELLRAQRCIQIVKAQS